MREYKVIKAQVTANTTAMERLLTDAGKEGWEIVAQMSHNQFIITTMGRDIIPTPEVKSKGKKSEQEVTNEES